MINSVRRKFRKIGNRIPFSRPVLRAKRYRTLLKNNLFSATSRSSIDKSFKYSIVRVMGNDLYPRHDIGQMINNLRFILENEPSFDDCEKLFVLNRLFDSDYEEQALELLRKHNAKALVIPFVPSEYAEAEWDTQIFGGIDFFKSKKFLEEKEEFKQRMRVISCGPKVRYAMNINGARNLGLKTARKTAEWIVVLDGNCIFTKASFACFKNDTTAGFFAPYSVVPMQRLEQNTDYWTCEPRSDLAEEPQLAFHCSAKMEFDERFIYGLRDKTSLLQSLGVPGPWHYWAKHDWIPEVGTDRNEENFYKFSSGGVFRLSSGGLGFELENAQKKRHSTRNASILETISQLNLKHGTRNPAYEAQIFGSD